MPAYQATLAYQYATARCEVRRAFDRYKHEAAAQWGKEATRLRREAARDRLARVQVAEVFRQLDERRDVNHADMLDWETIMSVQPRPQVPA